MDETKKYIISGTVDQIVNSLVNDFKIEEDIARFIVRISTEADNNQKMIDEDSLDLWYLNPKIPSTTPIFNTPFSISFTNLKKEMAEILFLVVGNYVFKRDAVEAGQQFVLDFLIALWRSTTRIKESQRCVYYRIIDVLKTSNTDYFCLEDVIPYDESQELHESQRLHECNRKPETWRCHKWHNEICQLTKKDIQDILKELVEKGVLKDNVGTWSIIK